MRMSRLARQRYLDLQAAQRALKRVSWAQSPSLYVRMLAAWEVAQLVPRSVAPWLAVPLQEQHPNAPEGWAFEYISQSAFSDFEALFRRWHDPSCGLAEISDAALAV